MISSINSVGKLLWPNSQRSRSGAFCQTPIGLLCVFQWEIDSVTHISRNGEALDLIRNDIGFCLTKVLHPRLVSLAGWPDLGRLLAVPNLFHLRMLEATVCSWALSMLQKVSCIALQTCVLTQCCLASLQTILLTSWLGFLWDLI